MSEKTCDADEFALIWVRHCHLAAAIRPGMLLQLYTATHMHCKMLIVVAGLFLKKKILAIELSAGKMWTR